MTMDCVKLDQKNHKSFIAATKQESKLQTLNYFYDTKPNNKPPKKHEHGRTHFFANQLCKLIGSAGVSQSVVHKEIR